MISSYQCCIFDPQILHVWPRVTLKPIPGVNKGPTRAQLHILHVRTTESSNLATEMSGVRKGERLQVLIQADALSNYGSHRYQKTHI